MVRVTTLSDRSLRVFFERNWNWELGLGRCLFEAFWRFGECRPVGLSEEALSALTVRPYDLSICSGALRANL